MTEAQIMNFLGLAMRARKVKSGESVLMTEIKKTLTLVILASDASDNTTKQLKINVIVIKFR